MPQWINPSRKNTMYVFYPGRGNNQTGVARFTGSMPFYTTTGEISYSRRGILAVPHDKIWLYPEINEINMNPYFLGLFGFLALKNRGITVRRGQLSYRPPYPTNEKGSVGWYSLRHENISMGQESDCINHKQRMRTLMDKRLGHSLPEDVVLYAPSRGAVTSFIALAKYKASYTQVKLCVLEAPFGTYTAVAKYFLGWIGKWLYRFGLLQLILGLKHKYTDPQPKAYVQDFPDTVPLVVVASSRDKVIPFKSSLNLALAVAAKRIKKINELGEAEAKRQGVMPVYFIQLDQSNHSLTIGSAKDQLRYQQFLHAIYKKHHLPYVNAYASSCDEEELSLIELTRGPLRSQVMWHDMFKKTHVHREKIQKKAFSDLTSLRIHTPRYQARVLEMCKHMSPYRKSPRRFHFFGEPVLQHEIGQLQGALRP